MSNSKSKKEIDAEVAKTLAEAQQISAEIEKTKAETKKLELEQAKIALDLERVKIYIVRTRQFQQKLSSFQLHLFCRMWIVNNDIIYNIKTEFLVVFGKIHNRSVSWRSIVDFL